MIKMNDKKQSEIPVSRQQTNASANSSNSRFNLSLPGAHPSPLRVGFRFRSRLISNNKHDVILSPTFGGRRISTTCLHSKLSVSSATLRALFGESLSFLFPNNLLTFLSDFLPFYTNSHPRHRSRIHAQPKSVLTSKTGNAPTIFPSTSSRNSAPWAAAACSCPKTRAAPAWTPSPTS